jgi:hypothetical protein
MRDSTKNRRQVRGRNHEVDDRYYEQDSACGGENEREPLELTARHGRILAGFHCKHHNPA